jgi:biopolymer transport protein ExbD
MGMAMRAGPRRNGVSADINVTPMADIMIVLLVIFMIAVPAMRTPPVPLPDARHARKHQEDPVIVVITTAGAISVGAAPMDGPAALEAYLRARVDAAPGGLPVLVQADRAADYATVAAALDACRRAGVTEISLGTRPRIGG